MGTIMVRCPDTEELVSTGIQADDHTFEALPSIDASPFRCSACGKMHEWSTDEAALVRTERADKLTNNEGTKR